jgi:hypothetical protein
MVLNIGQEINEPQVTTSENTGSIKCYFEAINRSINTTETCLYSLTDEAMQAGK